MRIEGLNPEFTYDHDEFGVGTLGWTEDKGYIFVRAGSALAENAVVKIVENGNASQLTRSNDTFGDRCGVAPVAMAVNKYGWIQVYGVCTIRAVASCAANALLYSSGSSGYIDDSSTSSQRVAGIALTTARSNSNGTAPAIIASFPYVSTT